LILVRDIRPTGRQVELERLGDRGQPREAQEREAVSVGVAVARRAQRLAHALKSEEVSRGVGEGRDVLYHLERQRREAGSNEADLLFFYFCGGRNSA
jgi:hypothetical protein